MGVCVCHIFVPRCLVTSAENMRFTLPGLNTCISLPSTTTLQTVNLPTKKLAIEQVGQTVGIDTTRDRESTRKSSFKTNTGQSREHITIVNGVRARVREGG